MQTEGLPNHHNDQRVRSWQVFDTKTRCAIAVTSLLALSLSSCRFLRLKASYRQHYSQPCPAVRSGEQATLSMRSSRRGVSDTSTARQACGQSGCVFRQHGAGLVCSVFASGALINRFITSQAPVATQAMIFYYVPSRAVAQGTSGRPTISASHGDQLDSDLDSR